MNKSLLDTDILSELFKGINPVVGRNASAYRQAFGRVTLSAITVTEIVSGPATGAKTAKHSEIYDRHQR